VADREKDTDKMHVADPVTATEREIMQPEAERNNITQHNRLNKQHLKLTTNTQHLKWFSSVHQD